MRIGDKRQLLMDNHIVEDTWNLERHLNEPERHPANPLMVRDRPWEDQDIPGEESGGPAAGTVMYDEEEGLFKMWYGVCRILNDQKPYLYTYWICYAVSKDGIEWEKPDLGAVEFDGSRANNIVFQGRFWASGSVIKDPREEDPQKRYKLYYSDPYGIPPQHELGAEDEGRTWTIKQLQDDWIDATNVAYSPDGIHWTPYEGNPVEVFGLADGQGNAFWDERLGTFVSSRRPLVYAGPWMRRIALSTSDDLIHWTFPEAVLIPDELDTIELYDLTVFPVEEVYFGLLSMFDSDKNQNIVQQLAFSRDLKRWDRLPARHTYLGLGEEGAFDAGMVSTARPLTVGDTVFLYYTGTNKAHDSWVTDRGIGLLTVKLDRFIGRRTLPGEEGKRLTETAKDRDGEVMGGADRGEEGVLLTRPFVCEGEHLTINSACPDGSIEVAVLDVQGKVYEGYQRDSCDTITGDSLRQRVTWKEREGLGALKEKRIRLKFYMQEAELYSFQVH